MDRESELEALRAAQHALRQHEEELWDELNDALLSAVPAGATTLEAEQEMAHALLCNSEAKRLFVRAATLGLAGTGFLRDCLEGDGPVGILRVLHDDWGTSNGSDSDRPV